MNKNFTLKKESVTVVSGGRRRKQLVQSKLCLIITKRQKDDREHNIV